MMMMSTMMTICPKRQMKLAHHQQRQQLVHDVPPSPPSRWDWSCSGEVMEIELALDDDDDH
jgi:hypothetical protein